MKVEALINSAPDLTITVVSFNTRRLLAACLDSLARGTRRSSIEVHVIDNASCDGSQDMVRNDFPDVRLLVNDTNMGFARANNQSWRLARGRYWLLLNSDTEVREGALDALVDFMDAHPQAGLASARLLSPDGSPQHCAQPAPGIARTLLEMSRLHKLLPRSVRGRMLLGPYWNYGKAVRVGWTWGTALVARRQAVQECGPLSEAFFMYGEDLEWCLRMRRRGWEVWFCPTAEVLHHGGQSPVDGAVSGERLCSRLDGIYKAVAMHNGGIYTKGLLATVFLATTIEWLRAKLRGQTCEVLQASLSYYRQRVVAILSGTAPA